MDARREELVLGVPLRHGELLPDVLVVAADRAHQDEEDGHGRHGEPGAVHELREDDDDEDRAGHRGTDGVDRPTAQHRPLLCPVLLDRQVAVPVPHHAGLAEREGDEDTDDVQLDEPGDAGVEDDDEGPRRAREQDDAVGEGEPVAPGVQLPGRRPSRARIEPSTGKPLKAVLAASTRIRPVTIETMTTPAGKPSKTAVATWAMTVCCS